MSRFFLKEVDALLKVTGESRNPSRKLRSRAKSRLNISSQND